AMDGYAVTVGDETCQSAGFAILETVAAGEVPSKKLVPGSCIKIMTGAMLPENAGKVIRVEYTDESDGVMRVTTPEPYENIIRRGENLKAGDEFIQVKRLGPGDIGSLAASGIHRVNVRRRLRVGIITTGSELREPGEPLGPGEIYNSSGIQLSTQIAAAGALPVKYGIVPDDADEHAEAVKTGIKECDLLLMTGGVSKGDFDYVPDTLREAGVEIVFHGVKVKPGRPTLFGRRLSAGDRDNTFIFGLPGNPVSTYILFEVLVKAFIYRLNGLTYRLPVMQGRLASEIRRRDTERMEFRPVKLTGTEVDVHGVEAVAVRTIEPVRYMGSAHLNALVEADGIVVLEPGLDRIEEGVLIDVRLI
ncbi:MAG: molybdopterin molybdotransferase MoeA, partial [Spirochaetaceae bacterium]|nr:molybdopterin molybdotransferase MoeA [Spirochaetaceae bacterium]